MATEKKKGYQVSADPNFDDFGIWLANREKEKKEKKNSYRDQSKRLIEQKKKK